MAAPITRLAMLLRIEAAGWGADIDLTTPSEKNTLTAYLSDGREIKRDAKIRYARGERERIMEAVLSGKGTAKEVRAAQAILFRRAQAVQATYGSLQREYERGIPAQ